ncbi:hypothetical protein C8F04DRAFT_1076684, partial [Mycena alexandri]
AIVMLSKVIACLCGFLFLCVPVIPQGLSRLTHLLRTLQCNSLRLMACLVWAAHLGSSSTPHRPCALEPAKAPPTPTLSAVVFTI